MKTATKERLRKIKIYSITFIFYLISSNIIFADDCILKRGDFLDKNLNLNSYREKIIETLDPNSSSSVSIKLDKMRYSLEFTDKPIITDQYFRDTAEEGEIWLTTSIYGGSDYIYLHNNMLIDKCKNEWVTTFKSQVVKDNIFFDKNFEFTNDFRQALEKLEEWTKVARDKKLVSFEKEINENFTFKFSKDSGFIKSHTQGNRASAIFSSDFKDGLIYSDILKIQKFMKKHFTTEFLKTVVTQLTGSNVSDDDFK